MGLMSCFAPTVEEPETMRSLARPPADARPHRTHRRPSRAESDGKLFRRSSIVEQDLPFVRRDTSSACPVSLPRQHASSRCLVGASVEDDGDGGSSLRPLGRQYSWFNPTAVPAKRALKGAAARGDAASLMGTSPPSDPNASSASLLYYASATPRGASLSPTSSITSSTGGRGSNNPRRVSSIERGGCSGWCDDPDGAIAIRFQELYPVLPGSPVRPAAAATANGAAAASSKECRRSSSIALSDCCEGDFGMMGDLQGHSNESMCSVSQHEGSASKSPFLRAASIGKLSTSTQQQQQQYNSALSPSVKRVGFKPSWEIEELLA